MKVHSFRYKFKWAYSSFSDTSSVVQIKLCNRRNGYHGYKVANYGGPTKF